MASSVTAGVLPAPVPALLRTVREKTTLRSVALAAAVFGALALLSDDPVGTLLAVGPAFVLAGSFSVLYDTPDVDSRYVTAGVGTVVFLGSLAWFWYETWGPGAVPGGGADWFPLLTAVVGAWILLDARKDFAEGRNADRSTANDDLDAAEVLLLMNHAYLVVEELRDGDPKTVAELAAACDLTASRVRDAIAVAGDEGMVYRVDGGREAGMGSESESELGPAAPRYALDESKAGYVAFVRGNAARVLRRLARPFR